MRRQAGEMFLCPKCGGDLRIASASSEDAGTSEIAEGSLVCSGCSTTVPIVRNIPRFVPSESMHPRSDSNGTVSIAFRSTNLCTTT